MAPRENFFRGAAAALRPGGLLGIYDAFKIDGKYYGQSQSFDRLLKDKGYSGIPAIDDCDTQAKAANFTRIGPLIFLENRNRHFLVYRKNNDNNNEAFSSK